MTPMEIRWIGSPHNSPRFGHKPLAIVIHIMEGTMPGADAWFNNPNSRVSTHYAIGKKGEIHQYVNEDQAAWGNGIIDRPSWKLLNADINPNLYTISIEHEGKTGEVWTNEMYNADKWLVTEICKRWSIPRDRDHIIGHYEIMKAKINCPGTGFDFNKLISLLNEKPKAAKEKPATVNKPKEPDSKLENEKVKNLQQEIKDLENQNLYLKEELISEKSNLREAQKKYISASAKVNILEEELKNFTTESAKFIEETEKLEKQKQILIKQNKIMEDQREEFKSKYEELLKELEKQEENYPKNISFFQRIKNLFNR